MTTPFAVSGHDDGAGTAQLSLAGELDQDTCGGLAAMIVKAAEQHGISEVVVDLQQVTFLGAAGVHALLGGRHAAAANGHAYRVINAHGIVLRVLTISGVLEVLAVTSMQPNATDAR
jgi:anti-anti-sigma factor